MSTPFYDLASMVVLPSGYKSGKIYAQKPLTTDGQLTFTRASTATRVNASGLIETVSSGVPRLDYQGSTCPKLLLEPQRTNLYAYSEQFDNADWQKRTGISITSNYGISPDGTQNADRVVYSSGDGYIWKGILPTASTVYTISVYAKGTGTIQFNFFDGTSGFTSNGFNLTPGWARYSYTVTTNSVTAGGDVGFFVPQTCEIWGAQLEVGAYPTSYIRTTSAAVTRLADAASKTGISSLIGQTEGTLFIDVSGPSKTGDARYMSVSNGTDQHRIVIYSNGATTAAVYVQNPTGGSAQLGFNTVNGQMKIAFAYKNNDLALYVNGVQRGTVNNFVTAFTFNFLGIGVYENDTVPNALGQSVSQALLFTSRLTNAQLAEITTL